MSLTLSAAKAGAMVMWFVVSFLLFFHVSRKKVRNFFMAMVLSVFLAYLVAQPFTSTVFYVDYGREIFPLFLENPLGIALGLVILATVLPLASVLSKKLTKQDYRSLSHMLGGLLLVYFMSVNVNIAFLLLSVWIVTFIVGEYLKLSYILGRHTDRLSRFAHELIGKAARTPAEQKIFMPTFFTLLGALIVIGFLPSIFAMASILVLSVADPVAAMVGTLIGRTKWAHNPKKSLEGSGALLAVAFVLLLALGVDPLAAGAVAVSVMLFESLALEISDNLIIPLITGMVLLII